MCVSLCVCVCVLKVNGSILNDSHAIAIHFNDYFLNSVQQLSQTFPAIDPLQPFTCEGPVFDLNTLN